jgi:hypothetical protein
VLVPANNKRSRRPSAQTRVTKDTEFTVGKNPTPTPPASIVHKTLQQALIDGIDDPVAFGRDFLDLDPYPAQQTYLRNARDCSEANFIAGNRVGKTWIVGLTLLWRAFYRYISPYTAPPKQSPHVTYKAVSASLTQDQANLAWTYAYTFATESKRFKSFVADVVHSPFPTMKLWTVNDLGEKTLSEVWSRSLAKNGLYLLGHSISFLSIDECAYIPNYKRIEDEVLRMRLADQGGALQRTSTPNGRNFFFEMAQLGFGTDPRYYSQQVVTLDNPYVSRTYIDEMKERMSVEYYAQNVLAEFISLSDFFRIEHIQSLYADIDYQLPYTSTDKNARYVMGADLGAMRDPTVVMVWRIDTKPVQLVYCEEIRNTSWQASRAFIRRTYEEYHPIQTAIDASGVGSPIAQQLVEEDGLENVIQFVFTPSSKPEILVRLQDAVQTRKFVFPFATQTKELVSQLGFYRLEDKKLTQDYVMALALTNLAYETATKTNRFETEINPAVNFIDLLRGGQTIGGVEPGDDVFNQPGSFFEFDSRSGLFVPAGTAPRGVTHYG